MSRLAKKPVPIPAGVAVTITPDEVSFKGPKGTESVAIMQLVEVAQTPEGLMVTRRSSSKQAKANLGTMWSLLKSGAVGVSTGFQKDLEIQGVGFRAMMEGKTIVLNLGFVNPVKYLPIAGVDVAVEKNIIKVTGTNKGSVGQVAAKIRGFKKPEPYKGKGIRYVGEVVRMKAGKKASA
jgi:large subunit ribosomal protein L6